MLSYCYDIETGFYYLQTRYYDPAIARFINADGYLSTDATGLLSYNMFAYCENNPVMYSDIGGSVRNYCVNMTDGGSYRVNVQLDDNFYVPNDKNIDKTKYLIILFCLAISIKSLRCHPFLVYSLCIFCYVDFYNIFNKKLPEKIDNLKAIAIITYKMMLITIPHLIQE